jgi:hypothetical protein
VRLHPRAAGGGTALSSSGWSGRGICCHDGASRSPVMAVLHTANAHHGGPTRLGDCKSHQFPRPIKSVVPLSWWSAMPSPSQAAIGSPPEFIIPEVTTLGSSHPRASHASDSPLRPLHPLLVHGFGFVTPPSSAP